MKIQSTLNTFLGLENDYQVFHLDWENKIASFINDCPTDVGAKWTTEFIHGSCRFISCTVKSANNYHENDMYPQSMIPMLKSHLQKCTRRGLALKAVKTAKHLMNLDLNVFLRRWTIIILEDAMINFNYTVLIWLMVAVSKGYIPSKHVLDWILGTVEATVNYPFKLEYHDYLNHKNNSDDNDLLKALSIRKDYGGMKGDAIMIQNIIQTFKIMRDSKGNWPINMIDNMSFNIHSVDYNSVKSLELEEWELSAIDFHVSDILEKWFNILSDTDKENWTRQDLKSCMWECSGSINHRLPTNNSWGLWKTYSDQVYKIAKSILRYKYTCGVRNENRKKEIDQRDSKRFRAHFTLGEK
jgi:hypothetical protein